MDKTTIQRRIQKLSSQLCRPQQLTRELEALLESLKEEKAAANYKKIIPKMVKSFGVPKPVLDVIAQEISRLGQKSPQSTLKLLKTLWQKGSFEERTITAKILSQIGKKIPEESLNLIGSFLKNIDNWSICDVLATQGLRGIMATHRDRILDLASECTKNEGKWIKRFGVATIVEVAHNKSLEIPKEVFDIVKPLMATEDPDVKKAIAWALREISKREPKMVKNFLKDYQNSQDKNTRWIVREGSNKL